MFEKIFNVFKKYEVTNEEMFKQFHEFHKWLIENMPNKEIQKIIFEQIEEIK